MQRLTQLPNSLLLDLLFFRLEKLYFLTQQLYSIFDLFNEACLDTDVRIEFYDISPTLLSQNLLISSQM